MKTAGQIFDEWASDDRAGRMGDHHWPLVRQGLALLPASSGRYLEVGVGSGYSIRHMATHQHASGQCLGIDVSPRMVNLAQKATADLANVDITHADFLAPSFEPSGPITAIFSMEVFYYFTDIQDGLDKAAHLLDAYGRLMVMVDFYAENRPTHSWPEELDTSMCLWSREQYRCGFEKAGFRNIEQHTFVNPDPSRREKDELGTLCTFGVLK